MTLLTEQQQEQLAKKIAALFVVDINDLEPYTELVRNKIAESLSLLDSDSQAARLDASAMAKQFIQRYYNEGAWKNKADAWLFSELTKTLNNVTTAMRNKCVEEVKAKAASYQKKDADNPSLLPNYRKQMAFAATALRETVSDLESLTLDQVEQEKQQ